jgi:hypothetical protein
MVNNEENNKEESEKTVADEDTDEFEKERLGRQHLIDTIQRISDESFVEEELDVVQKQAAAEARKYTLGVFKDIDTPNEIYSMLTFVYV